VSADLPPELQRFADPEINPLYGQSAICPFPCLKGQCGYHGRSIAHHCRGAQPGAERDVAWLEQRERDMLAHNAAFPRRRNDAAPGR
jgi:hypothetical protein